MANLRRGKRARSEESSDGLGPSAFETGQGLVGVSDGALKVQKGVLNGLEKRNNVDSIYARHCKGGRLPKSKLLSVLREVKMMFSKDDLVDQLRVNNLEKKAHISVDDFKVMLNTQSKVEQWAHSLPFPTLLADAISAINVNSADADPLQTVYNLTEHEIRDISEGLVEGLKRILNDNIVDLRAKMDAKTEETGHPSRKLQVVKMNCGVLDDYHRGVKGRTGFPQMNFKEGMKSEHCEKGGCNDEFETMTANERTTPKLEWGYVVDGEECPSMPSGRRIPKIGELMELKLVKTAELKEAEVIAVVLYTGPMFHVYNTILRRWPQNEFSAYKKHNNEFSTTIFVLVSALQKLLKHAPLPEGKVLYRGLGGTVDLPDSFFKSDKLGCKGYTEWAFMSTTSDKSVAVRYSGVRKGEPCPIVLEIRVGAVDRGVCIHELSQYPNEVEYLWLPCSWLEPRGNIRYEMTPGGMVRIIPCDARANVKDLTTDEHLGLKKNMHLAAFKYLVDDLPRRLYDVAVQRSAQDRLERDPTWKKDKDGKPKGSPQWTVDKYLEKIEEQCRNVWAEHDKVDANAYTNEGRFRDLSLAMAETANMALSKLLFWLEDSSSHIAFLHGYTLKRAHRERIGFLKRTLPSQGDDRRRCAVVLCQVKGLLEVEANERNELREPRLVAAAADGRSPADLSLLVAAGANVNMPDDEGNTALHAAVASGNTDAVRELVQLRADVNAVEQSRDMTALFLSARYGQLECMRVLIDADADVTIPNKNKATPVYIAAQNGHAECIASLAAAKADINVPREEGFTPVWRAACEGHVACVRTLVELRADVTIQYKGKTALDKALEKKDKAARKGQRAAELERYAACVDELLKVVSQADGAAMAEHGIS